MIERWQLNYGGVLVGLRFGGHTDAIWLLSTIPADCLPEFLQRESLESARFVALTALAIHNFGDLERANVEEIGSRFDQRPLIVTKDHAEHEMARCPAGGPGALACSYKPPHLSVTEPGFCSAQCAPGMGACCGAGFGGDCHCVSAREDSPAKPLSPWIQIRHSRGPGTRMNGPCTSLQHDPTSQPRRSPGLTVRDSVRQAPYKSWSAGHRLIVRSANELSRAGAPPHTQSVLRRRRWAGCGGHRVLRGSRTRRHPRPADSHPCCHPD